LQWGWLYSKTNRFTSECRSQAGRFSAAERLLSRSVFFYNKKGVLIAVGVVAFENK